MSPIPFPSPNFGPRKEGLSPSLVILHYTAMVSAQAALERLCDPTYEVSAHYLIHRDGRLFQMVHEDMRAWHAGAGSWGGQDDMNSRSIGIEMDNDGRSPFSEPQLATLELVLAQILQRWSIAPERVIGHSDMAPHRKADPGGRFPWSRLAHQNLAVWPSFQNCPPSWSGFKHQSERFGYPKDAELSAILEVLRQRFRPWATGPLDSCDMGIITELADRYPVDSITTIA